MFVVIIEDRHADVEVELWTSKAKAVARAHQLANGNATHPEQIEAQTADWCVLYLRYSYEGDCITVVEREVME